MKRTLFILLCLFAGIALQAQTPAGQHPGQRGGGREKILQMKIDYVRDNLGLSEVENKRFMPVYEKDLREDEALRQKQRSTMRSMKQNYAQMSDADVEKAITDEMQLEQQLLDRKKAQFEEYKKLIPLKKIVELKILERSFYKMLMEKLTSDKSLPVPPPEEK